MKMKGRVKLRILWEDLSVLFGMQKRKKENLEIRRPRTMIKNNMLNLYFSGSEG